MHKYIKGKSLVKNQTPRVTGVRRRDDHDPFFRLNGVSRAIEKADGDVFFALETALARIKALERELAGTDSKKHCKCFVPCKCKKGYSERVLKHD